MAIIWQASESNCLPVNVVVDICGGVCIVSSGCLCQGLVFNETKKKST